MPPAKRTEPTGRASAQAQRHFPRPGFNVFAYVDGRWLTPASGTLKGITRRSVIELAGEAGELVEEGRLSADDLRRVAEVLVTSTAGGSCL
jgi:branched-subunit amino acid aminotransferase/4-amino-4-deoxychorismate lyase